MVDTVLQQYEGERDARTGLPHGRGKGTTLCGVTLNGSFVNGVPHGRCTASMSSGVQYDGTWSNGVPHGTGTLHWAAGTRCNSSGVDREYTGDIDYGTRHGIGSLSVGGTVYTGTFVDGTRHGRGRVKYSSGDVFEGSFVNGWRHGSGSMRYRSPNGVALYEGEFRNDLREGQGVVHWECGCEYSGSWNAGYMCGHGEFAWPPPDMNHQWPQQRDRYTGWFESNERHGFGLHEFANGSQLEATWVHGRKQGAATFTFETGVVVPDIQFVDDRLQQALPTQPGVDPKVIFPPERFVSEHEQRWVSRLLVRHLSELKQFHSFFIGCHGDPADGVHPRSLLKMLDALKIADANVPLLKLVQQCERVCLPDQDHPRLGRTLLFRDVCSALVAAADMRFTKHPMLHDRVAELLEVYLPQALGELRRNGVEEDLSEEALDMLGLLDKHTKHADTETGYLRSQHSVCKHSITVKHVARTAVALELLDARNALLAAGQQYLSENHQSSIAALASIAAIPLTAQEALIAIAHTARAAFQHAKRLRDEAQLRSFNENGQVDQSQHSLRRNFQAEEAPESPASHPQPQEEKQEKNASEEAPYDENDASEYFYENTEVTSENNIGLLDIEKHKTLREEASGSDHYQWNTKSESELIDLFVQLWRGELSLDAVVGSYPTNAHQDEALSESRSDAGKQ